MPDRRSIFRLLALAGFLLTVALALWLAELRPLLVIIVMGVALLVAWTVEWLSWRQDLLRRSAEAVEVEEEAVFVPVAQAAPPVTTPSAAPPAFEPVHDMPERPPEPQPAAPLAPSAHALPGVPVDAAPPAEPVPEPAPDPAPVAARAAEPAPVAAEPVPEPPAPGPAPAPEPPRPVLRPVPSPAPVPAPAAPAAQPVRPAAASAGVVDLRTRVTVQPRRWNLWDLERRARDEAQRDPLRYEEWSYLFVHLRQFATPDGSLPVEFDDLVRESFGELLEHAG
ncbi:MAG TPA: hypothetical protein VD695_08190 [Gaiellaceae bacterium]|nr:hypothetical protein [Gaiellaceae bacterium]